MSNLIKIASKEFTDLLGNGMIHIVLATFLIYIFISLHQLIGVVNDSMSMALFINDTGIAASHTLFYVFMTYGAFVGVMIGYQAIAKDLYNDAMNTLITKPVYRDTIINGKLISIAVFLLLLMAIVTVFYTSAMFIIFGDHFASYLSSYIGLLPITIIVPLLYIMVFASLSMLISLVINSRPLGLTSSLLFVYISTLTASTNFAGVISQMFPGNQNYIYNLIVGWSPFGILLEIMDHTFMNDTSIIGIMDIQGDIFKLVLFAAVPILLAYTVFLRKDLS
ncbi:MAG: ABC-2 family transporter protein [Methanocella sp. PtaU1.Bin125]|nr:MAG: ABC-2 family transporter protein [Methanocella sp. PtaU1.Bin125]